MVPGTIPEPLGEKDFDLVPGTIWEPLGEKGFDLVPGTSEARRVDGRKLENMRDLIRPKSPFFRKLVDTRDLICLKPKKISSVFLD
ncbi:hypothetical protein [Bacillus sp. Marseille-Q3570]|uniref:hypothetical protein n=1 Tax=Bacillus sp. Marseille-Q3570 TaxID=2963522 RepID=UPI0021B7FF73|nr:hypothetical protein [Bacillus sp. Marseille-Q3570]